MCICMGKDRSRFHESIGDDVPLSKKDTKPRAPKIVYCEACKVELLGGVKCTNQSCERFNLVKEDLHTV